jgi:hypothetical protein
MQYQSQTGTGSKLGGVAAILIGVFNVVLVVYIVAIPSTSRIDTGEFYRYFADSPLALSAAWIMFTATAMLSYAVIPIVSDLVLEVNRDWARAATIFGIVGYTVLGVWAITLTRTTPGLAQNFVKGNEVTRTAILAYGLPQIDPDGWFMFGGTGTWLIVMNILALRGGKLPKLHGILGILSGFSAWATVFGALFAFEPLNLIASAGGALFYPAWFIWLGVRFLRAVHS